MFRRVLAGFLTCLLALGLLLAKPQTADAALTEADYLKAAQMLSKYGVVQGDPQGYRFYAQITRAEMAKVLVYSLGLQSDAARYVGKSGFPDTQGHWADGIIGVARVSGLMKGNPEGYFRPEAPITHAEVITVLARLAGLEPGAEPWPRTYVSTAVQSGIVPAEFDADLNRNLNAAAARGDVFVLLWRTLTEVKNFDGQNLLRRYLDRTAPTLTVDLQPTETSDLSLTVSGVAKDAAKVIINGTAVTPAQYGYFSHTVNLRVGPNTIRIQAVNDAGNLKETVVQITRVQAQPGAITVSGPAQVGTGQTATFTVALKDSNGEAVADLKSVKASVTPAELGTFDVTTGAFKAGTKTGQGTITVQAGAAVHSLPVAVVAGALDKLEINPAEIAVAPGASALFTVKGVDAYGNEAVVNGVSWNTNGGVISAGGMYQAPATAGSYTITAAAAGKTATAKVQPPNYQVASVVVAQQGAPTLRANGISETTFTATLLDNAGKPVTNYTGSVLVSSSAPGTASPVWGAVPVVDGAAAVKVRAGTVPGNATITVSTNLGKSGTAPITIQPQQLQSVRLSGAAQGSTDTWASGYVEAVAADQDGNPMRSPLGQTLVVHLKLPADVGGSKAWFISNDQPEADVALGSLDPSTGEVRTRIYIRYTAGMGTILIEGTPKPASMAWVQVMPGALVADQVGMPARVKIEPMVDGLAGATQSIYVNVLDANGFRVTQPTPLAGVVVTLRDQNGITWYATVSPQAGTGRARFDVVQHQAGTYIYTATLQPGNTSDVATMAVRAGGIARVNFTATPDVLKADNFSKATLQAELVDAAGNRVTSPAYQITFRQMTNNGSLQYFGEKTVTSVAGLASVTVTAGTVVAFDEIQVTVANPTVPSSPWNANGRVTTRGVPDRLAISYGDNDGDGVPGGAQDQMGRVNVPLTVYVDVLDQFGNLAAFDEGRAVTLTAKNLTTGEETRHTGVTRGGRAPIYVNQPKAASYALRAEAGTLSRALTVGYGGTLADAVIRPGNNFGLQAIADLQMLQSGGGSNYALVTVQLTDNAGNVTTNQTGAPIMVTLNVSGDGKSGHFTVNDSVGGTHTLVRSVQILPGASTTTPLKFYSGSETGSAIITASTLDVTAARTLTISSTSLGTAHHLAIDKPSPSQVVPWVGEDSATTGQTVVVNVQDSSGNRLSNYGGAVSLKAEDSDTRVVAVFDPVTQTWKSVDPWPGNGGGDYLTTPAQVSADRGQAKFRVRTSAPGEKLYTATASNLTPVTATGRFDGQGPANFTIVTNRPRITQNDRVDISVKIVDAYGTHLTGLTGNVTFTTTGGGWAGQFTNGGPTMTVPIVNGVATVTFLSGGGLPGDTTVSVDASTSLLPGITNPTSFVVDSSPPLVIGLTVTSGPIDAGYGKANEGDKITIQFDGAINGQSMVAGLNPGGKVTTGLGTVKFTTDRTIVFDGLLGLSTLQLSPGAIISNTVGFQVASVSLDATGTLVTITLGAIQGAAGMNPTVTLPAGATADVTVNPANPIRDLAGNGSTGPFNGRPVIGSF